MKPEPQKGENTGLFINIPTPYFKKALNRQVYRIRYE